MAVTVLGTCFTWPTLEALVTEGESLSGVQRMVGVYNVVWAFTAALGNFTGGAMLERLGLKSLFYVPAAIVIGQLGVTFWLESRAGRKDHATVAQAPKPEQRCEARQTRGTTEFGQDPVRLNVRPIAKARMFLRLAWLANPFAYVALNTLIAVMPGVARRLELSTMLAGFCCSVWCFSRLGAFVAFWLWDGWHYRFRGLLAAFVGLVATFAAILSVPNLAGVVLAQIGFGAALGLIYSSSLFYSMELSESKSEHGGIHEAAIGLGNFVGPAVGAVSGYLLPQYANSGALAVIALLVAGLGGMLAIWGKGRR
jgi:predicted MFS family arabinose efflux permease